MFGGISMEIRVLNYFLTVAREENITRAAEKLHLTQPTLSRQLKEMEDTYGTQLFVRGARRITLTDEGILLRRRAEEILSLVEKTENELLAHDEVITGNIRIGAGESPHFQYIMDIVKEVQLTYPSIHVHVITGDGGSILDYLSRGLIDFAFGYGDLNPEIYEQRHLPSHLKDRWGILMKKDDPLATKEFIQAEDLWDKPLIVSRQLLSTSTHGDPVKTWLKKEIDELNIVASFTMLYNGSLMVKSGLGYAIAFGDLINTEGTELCFRPLSPTVYADPSFIWKKYQVFSKASQKFLDAVKAKTP